MKIGIVGFGVVGKAIHNTLKTKHEIVKYDKFLNLDSFESLISASFIFISVPTPFDCSVKKVDDSSIVDNLSKLEKYNYEGIVIIKSTLPPGTCSKYSEKFSLEIVFNPEFLRESTSPNEDFQNQKTVVIGSTNHKSYLKVKNLFESVLRDDAIYHSTPLKEAEMIKIAQNTMLASRVALANMIYDACEKNQVDYKNIRKIAFDSFDILGPHMVQVPGPDGSRGFGGKCLPKDIRAFSTIYNSNLLDEIINYNNKLRDDLDKFLMNYND